MVMRQSHDGLMLRNPDKLVRKTRCFMCQTDQIASPAPPTERLDNTATWYADRVVWYPALCYIQT